MDWTPRANEGLGRGLGHSPGELKLGADVPDLLVMTGGALSQDLVVLSLGSLHELRPLLLKLLFSPALVRMKLPALMLRRGMLVM